MTTRVSMPEARERASARGVERDPGAITACRTPQRSSSSTNAEASAVLRFAGSIARETLPAPRRTSLNGCHSAHCGTFGLVETVGVQGVLVQLDAQAEALGKVEVAVAHLALALRDRFTEQLLGREAVRQPGVVGLAVDGVRRVGGRGDPDRSIEGARKVGGQGGRDRSSGTDPSDLRELRGRVAAGTRLDRSLGVLARRDALVGGDRDRRGGGYLRELLELRAGLLGELDVEGFQLAQEPERLRGREGPVGIDADPRLRPHLLTDGADLLEVRARAQLELEGPKTAVGPAAGGLGDGVGGRGGQGRIDWHGVSALAAEQPPEGLLGQLRRQVEDRHLERGGRGPWQAAAGGDVDIRVDGLGERVGRDQPTWVETPQPSKAAAQGALDAPEAVPAAQGQRHPL